MTDWPDEGGDMVPSPATVAALKQLDLLPTERVPLWAAYWLVAGYDGEHLVHLAGLHGDDPYVVQDALPDALDDCGVVIPESSAPAALVVLNLLARMHVDGLAGPRWVLQQVEDVVIQADHADSVLASPLGSLHCITDEWGAGWGRSIEELTALLGKACEGQLRIHSLGSSAESRTLASKPGVPPVTPVYVLEGSRIKNLEQFWDAWLEAVGADGRDFGRNLSAFNDCLWGGPGGPKHAGHYDSYIVEWRDHELSRACLGQPFEQLVEIFERQVHGQLRLC